MGDGSGSGARADPFRRKGFGLDGRLRDADGDGFLDYHDEFGRGLTNQGWKDSDDSVRFAEGTVAVGPVALAEVQGYAYEASLAGRRLVGGLRPARR